MSINSVTLRISTWTLTLALILSSPVFLSSCKKKRNKNATPAADTTGLSGPCKLDHRAPRPIIADMRKSEFHFNWLTAKITCEAYDDSSRVAFDVNLRMRKDSVIWMNVMGPLNIKIARILITKDSVKFIQFQDGTLGAQPKCFQGDFALLTEMLGTDVDFDMMQSLLVGNSVSFYEEDEKLRASINQSNCWYTLSTVRKRKLKRVLEGQKPPQDPLQTINLDPTTYKILNIFFLDEQSRTFKADYSNFTTLDSMQFPYKAEFFARGLAKSAGLMLEYTKVTLNKPTDFPFSIPDDCVPIIIPANENKLQD